MAVPLELLLSLPFVLFIGGIGVWIGIQLATGVARTKSLSKIEKGKDPQAFWTEVGIQMAVFALMVVGFFLFGPWRLD